MTAAPAGETRLSTLRYIADNWDTLGPQTRTHVLIVAAAMAVSVGVGVPAGVLAARSQRFAVPALAVASTLLTIPSFALFGLLTIWFGLGNSPVVCGLALYALLPIMRNTRTGILGVPADVVEAARGMGMTSRQVLVRIELPLAVPVVLAGVRQATVMVVAIATIGAQVGANDLGQPIFAAAGRTEGSLERLLAGVIPVALIGIAADLFFAGLGRLISRGRPVSVAYA